MTGKWLGKQTTCDICNDALSNFDMFYDGRMRGRTQWALMCKFCFNRYGVGLGTGKGREYDIDTKLKLRG